MLKKIVPLALALLVFGSLQAFAQLFVGGSIGFDYDSTTFSGGGSSITTSYTTFTLSPAVGYSLNEDLDIGGEISFASSDYIDVEDYFDITGLSGKYDATYFSIGPFVRYSLLELGDLDLLLYGQVGFMVVSLPSPYKSPKAFYLSASPQIEYHFSDMVSIYTFLGGVSFTHAWWGDNVSGNNFSISAFTNGFRLGAYFRF